MLPAVRLVAPPTLVLLSVLLACGCGNPPSPPPGDDGGTDAASARCTADRECADDVFCNGVERCAPDDEDADEQGCIAAASPRCEASQTCDETGAECVSDCDVDPDADGDGARAVACGGDDCDDADPLRHPAAAEVCDAEDRDEDCDATTIGALDADEDGHVSLACCNGELCGTDCDDAEPSVNRLSPEVCNRRDDDCDGSVDEALGSTAELCNTVDDDCDGSVDEGVCAPCPAGYSGFDGACTDVDECSSSTACHATRACMNAPGTYSCGPCGAGYLDDGPYDCADVNECVDGTDLCHPARVCSNQPGGYACLPCSAGYRDDGAYGCTNIHECDEDLDGCDAVATCVDLEPGHRCDCPAGYALATDGRDCVYDVAELSGLGASAGTLAPVLASGTTSYTLMVPDGTTSVTLTPTVAEPTLASIRVGGTLVASGTSSPPVVLSSPVPVVVEITLQAETGRTRTYRVTIARTDPLCPEAEPTILDCESGTITGTTVGASSRRDEYCGTFPSYSGPERFYSFRHRGAGRIEVTIATVSTTDHDLFVLGEGDACTDPGARCITQDRQALSDSVTFTAAPGEIYNLAYDTFAEFAPAAFTLEVSCAAIVCGDGRVGEGETCDDTNGASGDGCSASCHVEPGYVCRGAPSVCSASTESQSCANARPVTADATFNESIGTGPGPVGAYCVRDGVSLAPYARYYAVSIPAGRRAQVDVPTFGPELFAQESCDASGCLPIAGERRSLSLPNTGDTTITRIVGVRDQSSGTFQVSFRFFAAEGCGDGELDAGETCDDGNATGGDGCSASCVLEPSAACIGVPSQCVLGAPDHAYCEDALPITGSVVLTAQRAGLGGPPPSGTSCGFGARALYYEVRIPPGRQVGVEARNATGSTSFFVEDACDASSCLSLTTALTNRTAATITRLVGVRTSDSASASFDLAFTYLPTEWAPIPGACADTSAGEVVRLAPSPVEPPLSGDDARTYTYPMPFAFSLLGTPVDYWTASTNGLLELHDALGYGSPSSSNTAIPSTILPNGFVTAFWDDLTIGAGASVVQLVSGAEGSRRFVVEWRNARVDSVGGSQITFQVHLLEGTNAIELHYCAASGSEPALTGSSATIGVESRSGRFGVQVSHDTAGRAVVGTGYRLAP